jgi:hypothetical protein
MRFLLFYGSPCRRLPLSLAVYQLSNFALLQLFKDNASYAAGFIMLCVSGAIPFYSEPQIL